jgi:hypothetical protein
MLSHPSPDTSDRSGAMARLAEQSQLDFELGFYEGILTRHADYTDVLRVHGNNLTTRGRHAEGLNVDRRIVGLRPNDPLAHYNLACSLALLQHTDDSIRSLRRAVELGYRDFRYIREDSDLASIRNDPRFRQLLREYDH